MSAYVDIKDLSFTYPDGTKALTRINLQVNKGEFLVVMGANGAGKTTLLLHLNGVIPSIIQGTSEGKVRVAGMNPFESAIYEIAQKVAVVLQDPEMQLITPDVKTELAFGPENLGINENEILRRIDWALKVTRLPGMYDRIPMELSGGQKQRVALAAGLTMLPEIMILDEPTSQLDPIGATEIFSVLKELNSNYGMTIVMAEHKSEQITEFADKVAVLDKGQLVAHGSPEEVFSKVEMLERIGVKIPEVTALTWKLKNRLGLSGIPIRMDEAVKQFSALLDQHKIAFDNRDVSKVSNAGGTSGPTIMEINDLWYTYPAETPIEALRGISLKVSEGEFIGLIGQNGSGKTTLVKTLVGLLRPTKGQILIDGTDITTLTTGQLARKIGLILQNPDHQLFLMRVEDEVKFGPRNLGLSEEEVTRAADQALRAFGLEKYRNLNPVNLSFGDRRKLTVAAVMAMNPKVIILDEPTTGQDHKGRYEIAEMARKMHDLGKTVIMITHDMDLVARYAKRTIVLGTGRVLLDAPTGEVFSHPEVLRETFLTPPQITLLGQALGRSDLLTVDQFEKSLVIER